MNPDPIIPNISCPVPETNVDGYYTDQQSVLNWSRKDKFRLVMDLPACLRPLENKEACKGLDLKRLQMAVWGSVIPESTVPKIDASFGGHSFAFTSNSRPAYTSNTVNFTVDNRLKNYYLLRMWLDLQNNAATGLGSNNNSDFRVNLSIYLLDEYDKEIAEFIYTNAFITGIGGINVSSRDATEMESTFTFDYNEFLMDLI